MITAAALVPHPPLLLAGIGGGHDPLADLRSVCVEAVRSVVVGAEEMVVVGGDDTSARHDMARAVDVRRFGTTAPRLATRGLPLSLGVGARLLDEAGWTGPRQGHTLAWDADAARVDALADSLVDSSADGVTARPARIGVVVLGDGAARLDPRGPGALDDRAIDLEETLAKALADGDATALAELDPTLAVELMVLGRAALGFLGALALRQSAEPRATLLHREEPFGVGYLAATWLFG